MKKLLTLVIAIPGLLGLLAATAAAASPLGLTAAVKTTDGPVIGVVKGDTNAYLGIPYAAPPVRHNRWRDPQPVKSWSTPLLANRYSPMCLQPLRTKNSVFYAGEEASSEDCLYLNVWTPRGSKAADKRPVVVFVYGGGWTVGSGSMPIYSGEGLARKGAVVVTFNYRLGVLGFLAHPQLTQESRDQTSGNYALKDMLAALAWVKTNIAGFGGDPGQITLYGQSAGASAIALLMASPQAHGLFHRAIGSSGGYDFGGKRVPLKEAEDEGVKFASRFKDGTLENLRELGGDALMAMNNDFRPIIDGRVLTEQPAVTYAQGLQMKVPLLVGSNANESTVYPVVRSAEALKAEATKLFGDKAADFLKLYPADDDQQARTSSYNLHRDRLFASSAMSWAEAQSKVAPTYVYYFERAHPFIEGIRFQQQKDSRDFGAYHGAELVYAYQTLDALNANGPTRNWSPADRALATTMSSYWLNFARNGSPNGRSLQEWPRYTSEAGLTLVIGQKLAPAPFPNTANLKLLKQQVSP